MILFGERVVTLIYLLDKVICRSGSYAQYAIGFLAEELVGLLGNAGKDR